ncbi:hypothetical protein BC936DRAFT_146306 [Jimgerdemannia flammicorona]|uniref:Uncharacterized protein n=1 Tax=Jimgerdemannia flammicorona TaxID=994334 RepID=A0A433DLP4_9FUNG|nr:hypothetical protein BC936DRAFT_146306 [Jimgerdemannia flammicorona]
MQVQFLSPVPPPPPEPQEEDGDVSMVDGESVGINPVTPGQAIATDTQGHGTYLEGSTVHSSVAGMIDRVNKLISVRPLKTRYNAEIGDIVVGRITEVAQSRWKVDVNGRQDAVLMLSSVNLPGGVQRRKSESDQLQMRTFFSEGDLLVGEVQSFYADGATALQTRTLKYCKLRNGTFTCVPPALVQRCKSHFHTLPCGVDVILGLNGYIWVSKTTEKLPKGVEGRAAEEVEAEMAYSNKNEPITDHERETIARVSNCIAALARRFMYINDSIIVYAYEASLGFAVSDLLQLQVIRAITQEASAKAAMS